MDKTLPDIQLFTEALVNIPSFLLINTMGIYITVILEDESSSNYHLLVEQISKLH